ncbi:MDR family MFS transporter [Streptomyces sp. B-S-A8]|uniref:MDR family MFS transporter n=1 Tax=Streptomyces solicavernae TaxID=3043614 RepID=A0ABT6RZL1_9ACTN|nr:MDR family MFS transporter [Streptomyces sp. B-S-A8]MDI3389871.1 MDR family MFS transporter [Streptomyces sp. B-S-A8]
MAAAPRHAAGAPRTPAGRVRLLLAPLLLVMLLSQLDNMIVGTAMPTVVGELGGREHMAWVVTAYTLATAATTPVWGKLGDMYDRKGVFMTAVAIFLAGSALCGAAQDMVQLIAFRSVQGLGAGGLISGVVAIIGELVPPRGQGRYQGLVAGVMGTAMIAGPLVGGAVTEHLGWRWAFYVNLPLGALALALVGTLLHLPARRSAARADYLGAVLLTAGVTAAVLVTSWGGTEYAWGSATVLGLAAAGAVCLAAFALRQTRAAEPLVPPRLFRDRNYPLMALIGFLTGFVLFGAALFLPFYQQAVQGASATASGLLLLPMPLAMTAVGVVAGRVITATGHYKVFLVTGGALLLVGMSMLSRMGTGTSRLEAALCVTVLGAGLGCLLQTVMLVSQNSAEQRDIGVASAGVTLFRMLGSSVGVAVMGGLFNDRVREVTAAHLPSRAAHRLATAEGLQAAFPAGAAAGAVMLVAGLLVKEVALRRS